MDTDTDSVDRLNKHIEDLEGEIELLRHTLNDYISNRKTQYMLFINR